MAQLEGVAEQQGVSPRYTTAPERFAHLLRTVHARAGRRVVVCFFRDYHGLRPVGELRR